MDNIRKIEEFLKLMAGATKNKYFIDTGKVYQNLVRYGINERIDISSNFESWIEHFKEHKNIDVFNSPNWRYFCQFINSNYGLRDAYSKIKLYISIDADYIYDGAIELFEFLDKENIPHVSKIGSHVRFDDIVVRVDTPEDANKIIDFVNNSSFLSNGSLQNNPFAVSDGNVTIAWDGMLSYNMVTANWISQYINWEKECNNLEKVSYSRFYAFIENKYKLLFENGEGLDKLGDYLECEDIIEDADECMLGSNLLNFQDVTRLLLMSLNPKTNKNDVFKYVKMVSGIDYQNISIDRIEKLRTGGLKKEGYSDNQKDAVLLAFKNMYEKYGFDITRSNFLGFMDHGKYNYITSYKGARKLFVDNGINKEILCNVANDWNSKCNLFEENLDMALWDTYSKYDYFQVKSAVENLIQKGNLSYFTNENGYRDKLKQILGDNMDIATLRISIMEILTQNGVEIDNFISADDLGEKYLEKFNKKDSIRWR